MSKTMATKNKTREEKIANWMLVLVTLSVFIEPIVNALLD